MTLLRGLRAAQGLKRQRLIDCGEDEEQQDAIGNRKAVAIGDFTHSLDGISVCGLEEMN